MKRIILSMAIISSALLSCVNKDEPKEVEETKDPADELHNSAQTMFRPISSVEFEQPDPAMVKLGKHLFFDKRLSGKGNISCNSCHNLETYGVDNEQFSLGDDGSMGGRNSPTVFYAALHKMQFWDGRAEDVEEQAAGPILNPIEHNIKNEQELVERLKKVELYQQMFAEAFTSPANDPLTFENVTKAIGAFERTLMPESRFDKYLEGDQSALSAEEKKGLEVFINTGCVTCHSGVALGGEMLQKFGLFEDYWKHTESEKVDYGLFEVTENELDKYFFKVPGLRNIEHTGPYFHDGSVENLHEAVKIMGKLQRNVELTDEQVDDIVAFLKSLSADIPEEVKKNPFEA